VEKETNCCKSNNDSIFWFLNNKKRNYGSILKEFTFPWIFFPATSKIFHLK